MKIEWDTNKNDALVVVYTLRKTRIRMISARLATRKERKLYYEENY